jgi:hypothetical protein
MHIASKRPWAHSLRIEIAPLPVITPTTMRVPRMVLELGALVPLAGLTARLGYRASVQMTWPDMGQDPN